MKKLGIVLLNYLNYKDTLECIESILQQSYQDISIVVVDNNSNNNSFEIISDAVKIQDKVTCIKAEENLGFAKGNNLGISYLLDRGYKNIFALNNDTILEDVNYLEKLANIEYSSEVAMIGTTILGSDGLNQNPDIVRFPNRSSIFKESLIQKLVKLKNKITTKTILPKNEEKNDRHNPSSNVILNPKEYMLHGAAILFTENFFKDFSGFYPNTFLFVEEEILAAVCQKTGLRQMYVPSISLFHKEDQSSNIAWASEKQDSIKRSYIEDSLKQLTKVYKMDNIQLKKTM